MMKQSNNNLLGSGAVKTEEKEEKVLNPGKAVKLFRKGLDEGRWIEGVDEIDMYRRKGWFELTKAQSEENEKIEKEKLKKEEGERKLLEREKLQLEEDKKKFEIERKAFEDEKFKETKDIEKEIEEEKEIKGMKITTKKKGK